MVSFAGSLLSPAERAAIGRQVETSSSLQAPWTTASDAQLRAFRGAISTVRLNLSYGPRSGQNDNVLFTATYPVYGAEDRARMRAAYRSRGYTHWAIGPIGRAKPMYHAQYPAAPFDSVAEPDKFADLLEELWRDGEIPVYFALPDTRDFMGRDGWNWDAVERQLTPIYTSPRWQTLVRVVVLAWEPDIPASEWRRGVRWLARVFPHALRYIHLPADQLAPCRPSELVAHGGVIVSETQCWQQVAPFIHGVLFQSGAMGNRDTNQSGAAPIQQFLRSLLETNRLLHDLATSESAKGARLNRSLDLVAFEYASYWNYWRNVPETEARKWGDAAMGSGNSKSDPINRLEKELRGKLAGYGDGGTVATLRSSNPQVESESGIRHLEKQ